MGSILKDKDIQLDFSEYSRTVFSYFDTDPDLKIMNLFECSRYCV